MDGSWKGRIDGALATLLGRRPARRAPSHDTSLSVANAFIVTLGPATHMKLQKLVVLCDGFAFARAGFRLIDEAPQMWRQGPIMALLYDELKGFGSIPIGSPVGSRRREWRRPGDEDVLASIALTSRLYGSMTDLDLSAVCHADDSPWTKTARANGFQVRGGQTVDDDETLSYFQPLLDRHDDRRDGFAYRRSGR